MTDSTGYDPTFEYDDPIGSMRVVAYALVAAVLVGLVATWLFVRWLLS